MTKVEWGFVVLFVAVWYIHARDKGGEKLWTLPKYLLAPMCRTKSM